MCFGHVELDENGVGLVVVEFGVDAVKHRVEQVVLVAVAFAEHSVQVAGLEVDGDEGTVQVTLRFPPGPQQTRRRMRLEANCDCDRPIPVE